MPKETEFLVRKKILLTLYFLKPGKPFRGIQIIHLGREHSMEEKDSDSKKEF